MNELSAATGTTTTTTTLAASVDFAAATLSGPSPLDVSFANLSSPQFVTFSWDFGDGGTSTSASPTHQYVAPGSYTVTLTGYDAMSVSDVEIKVGYISVF